MFSVVIKLSKAVRFLLRSTAEGSAETNDSRSSAESTLKDDELFAGIPAEKAMQFAIILADINSKYAGQAFNLS